MNTIKLQAQMGWDSDSVDTFRIGGRVGVHVKSVGNKFMALHSLLNVGWLVGLVRGVVHQGRRKSYAGRE